MIEAAQACIDAVFEEHGIEAVLNPYSSPSTVLLLPSQGDVVTDFNGPGYITETGIFEIRAADFAGWSDGLEFKIGGELRVVQSHEYRDRLRLKVVLNTVEA